MRRFARWSLMAIRSRKQPGILVCRGLPSMRRRKSYAKQALKGFCHKSVVPKNRANSHRKLAAILRSWLAQSLIFRPLYWSKEFEDASASCSIHALWKKQCEKKGARDREKSAHLPTRSALLDASL